MAYDPIVRDHLEWLGYVQPVGLVVSVPALTEAGATINRNFVPLHRRFLECLPVDRDGQPVPELHSFVEFAVKVLGWDLDQLHGAPGATALPEELCAPLPDYGETLRPDYALRDVDGAASPWILLVKTETSAEFDRVAEDSHVKWQAAPQARMERLLRETGVPTGILAAPGAIRLIYAPRGETSGHLTFRVADMAKVAGRPILAALEMLLGDERLFALGASQRLPALLTASRKYQNVVSTRLAGQVLEALFELLRGFQAADDASNGALLKGTLATDPNKVYSGLLTVLMRLVFLLYAEDRGLMPGSGVYVRHYSAGGLFERLRADAAHHPDTMESRYGAWAHLLALFRLVWRGARHGELQVPARKGYLFDPERYPFLEGATTGEVPQVPDGVIFSVLSKLLLLDGERLSYRALDVEQIGSVYEAIMGFELQVAEGPSVAIRAKKKHGAPVSINLEALLRVERLKRGEWLAKETDQKLTGQAGEALKNAATVEDLVAALGSRIVRAITPHPVRRGAMIFQPSPERRRSGSHYTPRSLTGPIVQHALAPVLGRLGPKPRPEQILGLKVCDPAMGSGAFLVEACRQLGDALVDAWQTHGETPPLPPDEDVVLHARRQVAQRCLYGVDRNPVASDLAKLSLWLATLARDHAFTFLDHSLRHGDALVGLTAQGVETVHWEPGMTPLFRAEISTRVLRSTKSRQEILAARDDMPYDLLEHKLKLADEQIGFARMAGDLAVLAFFAGSTAKQRRENQKALVESLGRKDVEVDAALEARRLEARRGAKPIVPFHWEIEFPEVFALDARGRRGAGFDAIVGNPPFAGKNTLIDGNAEGYIDWLKAIHPESHGNADVVAHFYRRAFSLLRPGGCFGLIATNTIGQGDTRSSGLRWICLNGGTIYRARKRLPWPGEAAVVVSVVHVCNGPIAGPYWLDRREVEKITAYLFHAGGHEDPKRLKANEGTAFEGVKVYGMGFTFDPEPDGARTSVAEMLRLLETQPKNADRIFPYVGGEEVNESPSHTHRRYVINFEDFPLGRVAGLGSTWEEADEDQREAWLRAGLVPLDYPKPVADDWPELLALVRTLVKPDRDRDNREVYRRLWWQFGEKRPGLARMLQGVDRVLALCRHSPHLTIAQLPSNVIAADSLDIIVLESLGAFAVLQSRIHEGWARFMGSSIKDDLRYTPSDCFETFPFPNDSSLLEPIGRGYYDHRSALMIENCEGLTKTYNRFHNPEDNTPGIVRLRELHDEMDRAVLDAYEWSDLRPVCEFFPEFEEDDSEEEARPRRKKYRYRWPDEVRDEVLARLLDKNTVEWVADTLGATSQPVAVRQGKRKTIKNEGQMTLTGEATE